MNRTPLLISACLLGEACRYDGKSKPLPANVLTALRREYRLIPICPERDGGLPTPRPPCERRGDSVVTRDGKASTSYVQRRLQIGYNRAASLIERMEQEGVVSPANHAGKREILVGPPP